MFGYHSKLICSAYRDATKWNRKVLRISCLRTTLWWFFAMDVPGAILEGFLGTECNRAQHCRPLRLRLDYGYSPTASRDASAPQLD